MSVAFLRIVWMLQEFLTISKVLHFVLPIRTKSIDRLFHDTLNMECSCFLEWSTDKWTEANQYKSYSCSFLFDCVVDWIWCIKKCVVYSMEFGMIGKITTQDDTSTQRFVVLIRDVECTSSTLRKSSNDNSFWFYPWLDLFFDQFMNYTQNQKIRIFLFHLSNTVCKTYLFVLFHRSQGILPFLCLTDLCLNMIRKMKSDMRCWYCTYLLCHTMLAYAYQN